MLQGAGDHLGAVVDEGDLRARRAAGVRWLTPLALAADAGLWPRQRRAVRCLCLPRLELCGLLLGVVRRLVRGRARARARARARVGVRARVRARVGVRANLTLTERKLSSSATLGLRLPWLGLVSTK